MRTPWPLELSRALYRLIGDRMTVSIVDEDMKDLRYTLRYREITIYAPAWSIACACVFSRNSLALKELGLSQQDMLDWLEFKGIRKVVKTEKRRPKYVPLYD